MKALMVCVASLTLVAAAYGQTAEQRIQQLERRVAALEQEVKDLKTDPETKAAQEKARAAARERMRADTQKFSREEIGKAEQLYQSANRNLRAPEARDILQQMIEEFPGMNRTGCAVLYLAQQSEGEDREHLLKTAIADHADSFYGNGVQVGALARFYLAHDYVKAAKKDEAKRLIEELKRDYPDAISHSGELLSRHMPETE